MNKSILLTICLISSYACTSLQAQEVQNATLDEQVNQIIDKSGNYNANGKSYEVVERYKLVTLRENAKKRVASLQDNIDKRQGEIDEQKDKISQLTQELENTKTELATINKEKDSMSFFGNQMSKGSYQTMVWSIAGILLLGLLFFIFRFKSSNSITREARYKLEEVEQEFEEYRKKALEKEQKMGRQLQDERNKLLKATKG